jgi:hypothetical protein
LFSQEIQKFDTILKIENLKLHSKEIRVYKNYSTSTGLELFRMYYDENDKINTEFYYTVARKSESGEITIRVRNKKLNSFKNPEWIWMELIYSKIIDLPDFNEIRYKLKGKAKIGIDEEGKIGAEVTEMYILDGEGYYVQIRNNGITKDIEYPNPESYLNKFPEVDELIIFNDFLNIIKEEFKVFKKQ